MTSRLRTSLSANQGNAAGRGRTASDVQLDSQGNADALATTAKARQSEQGALQGLSPSAGTRGTSLSANHGNDAGRGRTASDVQGEQVGMKKARHRPSGHALPFE